jgi:hypothetical protein
MSSSILIRLGGVLAIVGGLAATILGLLYVLQPWGITVDFSAMALSKDHYENPLANMLLIGLFAAIERPYASCKGGITVGGGHSLPLRPQQVLRWSLPVTLWASWLLLPLSSKKLLSKTLGQ